MKAKIYIEISIVSYYTSRPSRDIIGDTHFLQISDEAEKLASVFVEYGPISETHSEDALHIALAITNGMDFLVTSNFHHINNAILKKEISKISEGNGYECPMICSQEEIEGA